MVFIKKYCFIIFGLILLPINIISAGYILVITSDDDAAENPADINKADIEMDYYYGRGSLRTAKNMICKSDALKHQCRMMCGHNNYGCTYDDCVCLDQNLAKGKSKNKKEKYLPLSKHEIDMLLKDFEDLIDVVRNHSANARHSEEVELQEHPALRHHIAHFCPNLGVARKCIRTCMKLGKPAFCGKDHRCYCGHKYDDHTVDEKVDIDDMYAKFRDLYAKYFGVDGNSPTIYGKL